MSQLQYELDKCSARMDIAQLYMWNEAVQEQSEGEIKVGVYYTGGPECSALYVNGKEVASIVNRLLK